MDDSGQCRKPICGIRIRVRSDMLSLNDLEQCLNVTRYFVSVDVVLLLVNFLEDSKFQFPCVVTALKIAHKNACVYRREWKKYDIEQLFQISLCCFRSHQLYTPKG